MTTKKYSNFSRPALQDLQPHSSCKSNVNCMQPLYEDCSNLVSDLLGLLGSRWEASEGGGPSLAL